MIMTKILSLIIAISLSGITVLSDYFVKKASLQNPVWNRWLIVGIIIYGLTAIGWVYVMKSMKLSTLGVVYGVSCITLLAIVSVFVFHEKITIIEIIGIALGIGSVALLSRFS